MRASIALFIAASAFLGIALVQAAPVAGSLLQNRGIEILSTVNLVKNLTTRSVAAADVLDLVDKQQAWLNTRAPPGDTGKALSEITHLKLDPADISEASGATHDLDASLSQENVGHNAVNDAYNAQRGIAYGSVHDVLMSAMRKADASTLANKVHQRTQPPSMLKFPQWLWWHWSSRQKRLAAEQHSAAFSAAINNYLDELRKLSKIDPRKFPPKLIETYEKAFKERQAHIEKGATPESYEHSKEVKQLANEAVTER